MSTRPKRIHTKPRQDGFVTGKKLAKMMAEASRRPRHSLADDFFALIRIKEERTEANGTFSFLVKWAGSFDDSWIPEAQMRGT